MDLRTTPYRDRYYQQCVDLMGDTWDFNRHFPQLRTPNLINELFFSAAIIGADHSEVIIDEEDRVHGYLFGVIAPQPGDRIRAARKALGLAVRSGWHYLVGNLGRRRDVKRLFHEFMVLNKALEAERNDGDGYVGLFFVGSSLRGLGWGRRLMQSFQDRCGAHGRERIYLWTDKGCNYGFYDHEGFKRIVELRSPLLDQFGPEPNGFAYARKVSDTGNL